ncbi:MAG: amino acid permease, partial [Dialister micraerophilus]|nr:amino acid permease [Dialister micraerophilus]
KSGNGLAILYAILLIGSIVGMTAATLMTTAMFDRMIIIGISIVLFIMPLVIYANRSPLWKSKVEADLKDIKQ